MSNVFISYSHKDEAWKDRLVAQLAAFETQGLLKVWDDRQIAGGDEWLGEIEQAMARAHVALLLVSADFLNSRFIQTREVVDLLERRRKEGLRVFPVIVRPCPWERVPWLSRLQVRPKDGAPLSGGTEHQIDAALAAIATEVYDLASAPTADPASARPQESPARERRTPENAATEARFHPPPAAFPDPGSPAGPPALLGILPGSWLCQSIHLASGMVMGSIELQVFPDGSFSAIMTSPMERVMVQGMWRVLDGNHLSLGGQKTNGFFTLPYAALIELDGVSQAQLSGTTGGGERVVFRRVGL